MTDLGERENNNELVQKVTKFMHYGCGCTMGAKQGPCSKQLSNETVLFNLNNCLELSSRELDLVILASIQAFTRTEAIGEKRNRSPRCSFFYQSNPICKEMFLHFYGISYSRFRHLKGHYEKHGIGGRSHSNTRRLPENALPKSAIEDVHTFLVNYVEENAITVPEIPGFKSDDVKILPSCEKYAHAFICELDSTNHNPRTHLEFRVDLIHKLVENYNGRKDQGRPRINPLESRFTEIHFPQHVPHNEKGQPKEGECAVCKAAGWVKRCSFMCLDCNVGLCVAPCFRDHHTR